MSKVALITGGQQGIGLGVAETLAGAGFRLALVAEVDAAHDAVHDALRRLGDCARYYRHDLRDHAAVEDLLTRIEGDIGPVSTLVSNAGIPARVRGDMLDLTSENYDVVMDVNLKGAFFLAQAVARRMVSRASTTYRSILFVTSISAEAVSVERAEYCISKAGAGMMAQLFAARLAADEIGVFDLRPGIIATDMTSAAKAAYDVRIADGLVPARRWGMPEDIGQIVVPLATGQMAFATGAVIPVDGGLSIHRL